MSQSKIEWTEFTWNFLLGCNKISPGCEHCYAIRQTARGMHESHKGLATLKPANWTGLIRFVPERLLQPIERTKPTRYFVNSLSDFFHERVPLDWQIAGCKAMSLADWHVFQVLTKREKQLRSLLRGSLKSYADSPNILWGVTVDDRKHGLPRIEALRQSPARYKWLSIEPLLEDLGEVNLEGIDWVVVGGESGPGARPMEEDWVLSLKRQCDAADVPFFFKQWGGVNKKKTGRRLKGRTFDASPELALSGCPSRKDREARRASIEDAVRGITIAEISP